MRAVVDVLEAIVAEGRIPALSVNVRVEGAEALHHTVGHARLVPSALPALPEQRFDLASVTKVVAGATLAAHHLASGALRLDAPAARWLPGVDPRVTVAHLLTHASGLPAWAPLHAAVPVHAWGTPTARATILAAATRTALEAEPGARHVYSDLGFLWLLQILEALGGPLQEQLAALLGPAGLGGLSFDGAGAAATEDCPLRGRVLEGEVHDANCAAMGGVSTHAGVFGDARTLARFGEATIDAARGVRSDLPSPVSSWACAGPGTHRGGWDGVTPGASSTGGAWPSDTVGHLGYTGTSVWMSPSRRVVVALLTNRVHPRDDKGPIREARPRVHDAVATALGWRV
jgi:CubicO group peptidase (beta-lactamase class C family)